ncbi:MAG TPA: phosphoribosyltransferase family protein [Gemmatimonadaceae bacterium]|nr:phosphoribosyltransferase family protein [Gemmatimonadaceae bacterium]
MPVEPASSLVHSLKYGGWSHVAGAMSERMSRLNWPVDVVEERGALIPVPLSSARNRERGYNQSALLARGLAERWRIPLRENALLRARDTRSQTELTPEERLGNVAGSFRTGMDFNDLAGEHVILVDDVVTTAATMNECARVLYQSGARIISYVTFGRAHASGDRI